LGSLPFLRTNCRALYSVYYDMISRRLQAFSQMLMEKSQTVHKENAECGIRNAELSL